MCSSSAVAAVAVGSDWGGGTVCAWVRKEGACPTYKTSHITDEMSRPSPIRFSARLLVSLDIRYDIHLKEKCGIGGGGISIHAPLDGRSIRLMPQLSSAGSKTEKSGDYCLLSF